MKTIFEQAVEDSKNLKSKPSNESLLQLYSFYKQATVGNVSAEAPPNPFDFVAKAKFEAWQNCAGMDYQTAEQEYINLVEKLKG